MQYLVVNVLIVFIGSLIIRVFSLCGFGKVESLYSLDLFL